LQKSSEQITGLSKITKEFDKNNKKKSNFDIESNDDKDINEINFLKLVTFKKVDDKRSFLKSEDLENEKNNIIIKLEDVMEEMTYEVAEKYQKIKHDSSNQN